MRIPAASAVALLCCLTAAPSFADDAPARKTDKEAGSRSGSSKADAKSDKRATPSGRHDPKNVTGISVFMEKLVVGNKLLVAGNTSGAMDAYRGAITEDDKDALGPFYLSGGQILSGDLTGAEVSLQNAQKLAGSDDLTRARVLFGLADLKERQAKADDAKNFWTDYAKFAAEHAKIKSYPDTAAKRQQVIDVHNDLAKKYGEVKARIKAREKEVEDAKQKEAQKDAAEDAAKGGKR